MKKTMRAIALASALVLSAGAVRGQSSPSYRLTDHVFNQGGHPAGGVHLASAGFRMSLDSVGEGIASPVSSGATLEARSGFGACYAPAAEVGAVRVSSDRVTFFWSPDRAASDYRIYSGTLDELPGSYGTCRMTGVQGTQAPLPEIPESSGYFYLITARDLLGEEGTKGTDGNGHPRGSLPCP